MDEPNKKQIERSQRRAKALKHFIGQDDDRQQRRAAALGFFLEEEQEAQPQYQLVPLNTKENVNEQLAIKVNTIDDVKPLLKVADRQHVEQVLSYINTIVSDYYNEFKAAEEIKLDKNNQVNIFVTGSVVNNPLKGKVRQYGDVDVLIAPASYGAHGNSAIERIMRELYKTTEEHEKQLIVAQDEEVKSERYKSGDGQYFANRKKESLEARLRQLNHGLDVVTDRTARESDGALYVSGPVVERYAMTAHDPNISPVDITIMNDMGYNKAVSDKK